MTKLLARLVPSGRGVVLPLLCGLVLALPVASSGQVPTASVTVCQVTGSASAPSYLEVQVSVDEVAAFLAGFPGSFVGSCPSSGGDGTAEESGVDTGGSAGGTGPVSAAVTVCRVTGSVDAPDVVQLTVTIDQVVAFLNQNPGSFIGTCPGEGGAVTQPAGTILGLPAGSALMICNVTGSATALEFVQVNVAVDRVAAFLNQNPGSFVGLCPSGADPNGTVGNEPLGYVTICRVTGDADTPLAAITIRAAELGAYLTRAGTIVPAPTEGCPAPSTGSGDGDDPAEPSTTTAGESTTIVVQTTPNTVVTASGAGVKESTKSNAKGKATLKVKPKKKGIVTVRASGNKVVKRVGVASSRRTAANLTG